MLKQFTYFRIHHVSQFFLTGPRSQASGNITPYLTFYKTTTGNETHFEMDMLVKILIVYRKKEVLLFFFSRKTLSAGEAVNSEI